QSTPKAADLADAGAQVVAGLRPTGDSAGRARGGRALPVAPGGRPEPRAAPVVPSASPAFDGPETRRASLEGVERCLLLSAVDQRLVQREARFVEAAKKVGVRHLVKFSGIVGHPAGSSS